MLERTRQAKHALEGQGRAGASGVAHDLLIPVGREQRQEAHGIGFAGAANPYDPQQGCPEQVQRRVHGEASGGLHAGNRH